jgi:hypothetical protein
MALAELQMVEGLESEVRMLPDLPQGDVVLLGVAVGRLRVGQVGKGDEELLSGLVELVQLRLQLLQLRFQDTRLLAQLGELRLVDLPRPCGLLDFRGEPVLLCPDRVDPRVELPPALIDAEQLIDLFGRPTPRQRRADSVRVGADLLQIERGSVPRATGRRLSWSSSGPGPVPR